MKIKDGFLLKEVAGNNVVIPVGNMSFNAMLSLNETGVVLWKKLEKGAKKAELMDALMTEYDISKETAENDVVSFVEKLKKAGILDNES